MVLFKVAHVISLMIDNNYNRSAAMSLRAIILSLISLCFLTHCEIQLCMCHFYYTAHLQITQANQTFTVTFPTPFTNFPIFSFCKSTLM